MLLGKRINARTVEQSGPLSSLPSIGGGERTGGGAAFPSLPGQLKPSFVLGDTSTFLPVPCDIQSFEKQSPFIESNSKQKHGKRVDNSPAMGLFKSSPPSALAISCQDRSISHGSKIRPASVFDEEESTFDLIASDVGQKEEMFLDECYTLMMETDSKINSQGLMYVYTV